MSPDSLINALFKVVGSGPRTDLACQFRRSWRSSRVPTSLGSHESLLPYGATAWTQMTWMAIRFSGITQYVFLTVQRLASAGMAFFMYRLWCPLNVKYASIQMPIPGVACLFNSINWFPPFIFAVSFGQRCFLWHCVNLESTASVVAISKVTLVNLPTQLTLLGIA